MACTLPDDTGLNWSVVGRIIINAMLNFLVENGGAIGTDTITICDEGNGGGNDGIYCAIDSFWGIKINGVNTGEKMYFPYINSGCSTILTPCYNDETCCSSIGLQVDDARCVTLPCHFKAQNDLDGLPINNQDIVRDGAYCLKILTTTTYIPDDDINPPDVDTFNCLITCQKSAMNGLNSTQADLKTLMDNILNALCCNPARIPKVFTSFDTNFLAGGNVRVIFFYNKIPFCSDAECIHWNFSITNFTDTDVQFYLKFLEILNSLHSDMMRIAVDGFNANIDDGRGLAKYIKQNFILKYVKDDNFPAIFNIDLLDGNEEI